MRIPGVRFAGRLLGSVVLEIGRTILSPGSFRTAAVINVGTATLAAFIGAGSSLNVTDLAIFPIVFANGLDPAEGPGLIFVSLPIAFGSVTGGLFFGTLFFILLFFAVSIMAS